MAPDIPPQPSLIEYPSAFPIKVMGANAEGFEAAVVAIAEHFDPTFDRGTVERRESRGGHYRTDFPQTEARWKKRIYVLGDGEPATPQPVERRAIPAAVRA